MFLPRSMICQGCLKLFASFLRTTATVSSCEPSSETMSSKCGYVWAARLSIVQLTHLAALYVGTMTLIRSMALSRYGSAPNRRRQRCVSKCKWQWTRLFLARLPLGSRALRISGLAGEQPNAGYCRQVVTGHFVLTGKGRVANGRGHRLAVAASELGRVNAEATGDRLEKGERILAEPLVRDHHRDHATSCEKHAPTPILIREVIHGPVNRFRVEKIGICDRSSGDRVVDSPPTGQLAK